MAKTQQKAAGAKTGKGKKFKKRERKNVPFGLVFIQAKASLKNYRQCRDWVSAVREEVTKARSSGIIPNTALIHFTGQQPLRRVCQLL